MKHFLLSLLLMATSAHAAERAEVSLSPTRVIIEKGARFATVNIINTGTAMGDYNLELIDLKMNDVGDVVPYDAGETPQYSAVPYMHTAPKSFSLGPGGAQKVRIILNAKATAPAGEYRAHMKIALKNDGTQKPEEDAVQVQTDLITTIPVILRFGETAAKTGVKNVSVTKDGMNVTVTREGDRSVIGNVTAFCNGKEAGTWRGLAIYRPNTSRTVTVHMKKAGAACAKPTASFVEITASKDH